MKVERHGNSDEGEIVFDTHPMGGMGSNSFDQEGDNAYEPSKVSDQAPPKKSRKGLYIASLVMVVALSGAAVAGYLVAKKDENVVNSQYSMTGNFCQPGSVKDTREPILELALTVGRMNRSVTAEEQKEIEKSVLAGFNDASGGCTDPYERWMYGIVMVNQTLTPHAALAATGNSAISHTFVQQEYHMILKFETIISCNNCTEDEAFASNYPSSFSAVYDDDDEDEEDEGAGARALGDFTGERVQLSAAAVVENIERNLRARLPDLGQITEATILTHGSATSAHLSRAADGADEDVSTTSERDVCSEIIPFSVKALTFDPLSFRVGVWR
jgi:hypothetical protein